VRASAHSDTWPAPQQCNLFTYIVFFFFFNDTATTEIYTLSLHDALLISLFDTAVGGLEAKIAVKVTPYQRELELLKSIGGFGDAVAHAWLAEIGPAPHEYFASPEKLASWG